MRNCQPMILGLLLLTTSLATAAPNTAAVRQTIQGELNRMDAAFARKDLDGSYAYYTPDYQRINVDGKRFGLASDRQGAAHFLPAMQSIHATNQIQSVRVTGGRAAVILVTDAHVLIKPNGAKTMVTLDDTEKRSQVWVARGTTWLMQSSRTLTSRQVVHAGGKTNMIVNGKQQK